MDGALIAICVFFVLEAVLFAPLNLDAGWYLRLARAHSEGAVPCRDVRCRYTPLATIFLSVGGGQPVPSIVLVQLAIFACALLTYRLARSLEYARPVARRALFVTWALLLANDGRGVLLEPFALVCLLLATNAFLASRGRNSFLLSGLWVALGFWSKQYALLGWVGLLVAGLCARRVRAAAILTAGVLIGVCGGFLLLLAVGAELRNLADLLESQAYSSDPLMLNLLGAPEIFGALVLTVLPLAEESRHRALGNKTQTLVALSVAALLPFYFRGYRHYWHFAIPFLILMLLRPSASGAVQWVGSARAAAALLMAVSIGLDIGRCVRDLSTDARGHQRRDGARLAALGAGSVRTLYLVQPSLLPWINPPLLAPRTVGPEFISFNRADSDQLLSVADVVVWDTSQPDGDQALRQLSQDPKSELERRGFVRGMIAGPVEVYSR